MSIDILTYHEEDGLKEFESLDALGDLAEETRVWVDIEGHDPDELMAVAEHFGLHELAIEDCLDPGHFPKIEDFGNHIFMIFRSLRSAFYHEGGEEETDEPQDLSDVEKYTSKVAIFASDDYVVSFRQREVAWLDAVYRQVKQLPELTIGQSTDALAHKIIDVLIDRFTRGIDVVERDIEQLEDKALREPENFDLSELLDLKRDLVMLRQIMREQKKVLYRLASDLELIDDKRQRRFFSDIDEHAQAIIHTLDQYVDSLGGVRDAYFAISNVRLGDIMRILAVIATVGVPLNLVVGMYGMNFEEIPLLHNPNGFWLVVFVILFLAAMLMAYFKRKRWL